MQEACIDAELISVIGMRRLIETLSKNLNYKTGLREKRVYDGGISSTRNLPSTSYTSIREKEVKSIGYTMYRYRQVESEKVDQPDTPSNQTVYSRWFEFTKYMSGIDLGSTMVVSFTTTVFPDGGRREGGSICFRILSRPERSSLDLLVIKVLGLCNGMERDDIFLKVISMSSSIRKQKLDMPSFSPLEWKDVSMSTFRSSVIVDLHEGEDVFYVLSPSGTFIYDRSMITPVDLTISSSLTVLLGRYYKNIFYPYDIMVREDISVQGHPYGERLVMLNSYDLLLPKPLSISRPRTSEEFFSFVVGKKELLFYSTSNRYIWNSSRHVRVFVGERGLPFGLEGENLVPLRTDIIDPIVEKNAGDMVEVENGKIVDVLTYTPSPMKKGRVEQILSSDTISSDSLSGRNCKLYSKYVERVASLLYSFYETRGVKSVLDVSVGVDRGYWSRSNISTYALTSNTERIGYQKSTSAIVDENMVVGDVWEVEFINDMADVPSVGATNIFRTTPTVDDLDTYVAVASRYVSFISTEKDHGDRLSLMEEWGWELETEYRINKEELLPIDAKCREDLTLYIWRQKGKESEVIRLIYNPIAVGTSSKVDSPYGSLMRIGTLGSTISGRDDSLIHSILTSYSSKYRKYDKVGKTLDALRNGRNINLTVPVYLIPKDSWKMYWISKKNTYIYDSHTKRPKGIVIFNNKGHWEPLAKKTIDGSLDYIW
jgi:hypothetical protein